MYVDVGVGVESTVLSFLGLRLRGGYSGRSLPSRASRMGGGGRRNSSIFALKVDSGVGSRYSCISGLLFDGFEYDGRWWDRIFSEGLG